MLNHDSFDVAADGLNNKSIQGKIFDQSMLSSLKGDEDQYYNQENPSNNISLIDNLIQRQSGNSNQMLPNIRDKSLNSLEPEVPCKNKNLDLNKLLLINESSNETNQDNQWKTSFNFETEKIIKEEDTSKLQTLTLNQKDISIQFYDNTKNDSKEEEAEVDKCNSLQLMEKNELNQSQANQGYQPTTPFSKASKLSYSMFNKNPLNGSNYNFEKAANIINKVISKSMNRVQRINKHAFNFIQLLKYRTLNRKMQQMSEVEIDLLNDRAHYWKKKEKRKMMKNLYSSFSIFSKLKIPLLQVFMPSDTLRVYWDIFQVFFIYSFLYIYSILIFFANQERDTEFIQNLFKYTLIVFSLDMLINLNTAYYDKDLVIKNRKQIVLKYLLSGIFLTDSINLLVICYKIFDKGANIVFNPNYELSTFIINILTFFKLNGVQQKRNRFSYVFTLKENQKHIMRLFDQLLTVISVAHIVSLCWYLLGAYEMQNNYSISWIEKYNLADSTYLEKYIYSLYWSITTMTTVGYGDISACNYIEALFITIAMIIFSCVFAYSINNIGFILQEIEKTSKLLNDHITIMQRYLNRKSVNTSLQSRVRHYLSFLADEQKDRDQQAEIETFGILSNKLRDEITVEINQKILKHYSFFTANFSESTLRKLVFIMKEVLIAPNEIIFEEGDHDDQSLYLIENGTIEIYQWPQNGVLKNKIHILKSLSKNDHFGDISFFSGLARKASARSVNLSTLYKINRKEFIELIKQTNEDFERFKMLEEQIKFQQDLSSIFIECYVCNIPGHLASHCPKIHQKFDTQFKILKENFSIFQERTSYTKRKIQKHKFNPKQILYF